MLTNVFTQFFNAIMTQGQTLPGYKANLQTDCVFTSGANTCANPTTRNWKGPSSFSNDCTAAGRQTYSTACTYMFSSGCTWGGASCSGTAVDGGLSACSARTTELACLAYQGGSTTVQFAAPAFCTWNSADSTCDGTNGQSADYSVCRARTQSTCTNNDISSSNSRSGCIWDVNQASDQNKCQGKKIDNTAHVCTPSGAASSSTNYYKTICDCEGFCTQNTSPNPYYVTMNDMYSNYTVAGGKFELIKYENIGFSAMVFFSSLMNFKAPGSANPNLETVS